jgi:hypothetical protein
MADGVGGMAVDGGSPRLTLSSLAVLVFHGGGAGAGVHGQAGDGRDILLDPTATAPNTVTMAGMAMEIPATDIAMEIPATDLATEMQAKAMQAKAMRANTARQLDRG